MALRRSWHWWEARWGRQLLRGESYDFQTIIFPLPMLSGDDHFPEIKGREPWLISLNGILQAHFVLGGHSTMSICRGNQNNFRTHSLSVSQLQFRVKCVLLKMKISWAG